VVISSPSVAVRSEGTGSGSSSIASAPHVSPAAPLPDSISLLLFASFDPERLLVESDGEFVVSGTGSPVRRKSIAIEATDSGLLVDGTPTAEVILTSTEAKPMALTASGRIKLVRGGLDVTAVGGRLAIVAHLPLREYLAATLAAETAGTDPIEYLVALSVLQRNYLRSHPGRHDPRADLCDNTHCQAADEMAITAKDYAAVDRSASIELASGSSFPCYYSGSCGGSTLTPSEVWKRPESGYSHVTCSYCKGAHWYHWQRTVAATPATDQLMRSAPPAPFIDDDFKIRAGREIGFNIVLSNTVSAIRRQGKMFVIEGSGFGHRIGLCQEGARRMASHGRSAPDILRYYFPTARVGGRSRVGG
jgi:stage II sporulation protein D